MSRTLNTNIVNALSAPTIEPFYAIDLDLDSGPVYLWTGTANKVISGKNYLGAGEIMSISRIEETTDLDARGAVITISGIPSDYLSMALNLPYLNRECRIYFGLVSDADNYVSIFTGEIDTMDILEEPSTATIQIRVENVLVTLERPVVRRYTHEDQITRYPGDLGLIFVAGLQDKEIFWGRTAE